MTPIPATTAARAFEGFLEGQKVTDAKTGNEYELRGIRMRGDGAVMARVSDGAFSFFLPLSRFRGQEAA